MKALVIKGSGGPEVLSYGAMIKRVAASMLLPRPMVALPRGA